MLEARSLPLRNYLMQHVMPTLTEGLIEACKVKPEDPIDYLVSAVVNCRAANFLRYTRSITSILSKFLAMVEAKVKFIHHWSLTEVCGIAPDTLPYTQIMKANRMMILI